MLWTKIQERFYHIGPAFKFFDVNNSQTISFPEFLNGLERLRMSISEPEARKIFAYLDNDFNGEVQYNEFCQLCEEKRRKIDPFDTNPPENRLYAKAKTINGNNVHDLNRLLDQFWIKLCLNFTSMTRAFEYFDLNKSQTISFKEFFTAVNNLKMQFTEGEARKIF
jgi:Ca2+-binding EF-hand superfamily protein